MDSFERCPKAPAVDAWIGQLPQFGLNMRSSATAKPWRWRSEASLDAGLMTKLTGGFTADRTMVLSASYGSLHPARRADGVGLEPSCCDRRSSICCNKFWTYCCVTVARFEVGL